MSDQKLTESDAADDSQAKDASYSLDERTLTEEEQEFAQSMGFGDEGNEAAPTVSEEAAVASASEPESESPPAEEEQEVVVKAEALVPAETEPSDWEEIAPRSASDGSQEPIEDFANAVLADSDSSEDGAEDSTRLHQTIENLEGRLGDRDLELSRLREAYEQEVSGQAQGDKDQEGLEAEYETLLSERDELIDQLSARSGELVRARDQIEQLATSLRKARSTLAPLPAGEKALRAEVLGLRARVSQSQQDSTAATARAEGLQTELAISEAKLDERDHERDLLEGERILLASQLAEREIEFEASGERERSLLAMSDRLQSENQELKSTQIALEETLEARDLEISAREEHLAVTREGLALRDEQLLSLARERDQIRRQVEEAEASQQQREQAVQQLEDKVHRREARIATLAATLEEIESALGRKISPKAVPES